MLAGLALGWPSIGVAGEPEADRPIALPPFIVEDAIKGRPWRYAEGGGFEILSRSSDGITQRVLDAHHRLHQLLAEILPDTLQVKLGVPRAVILFDEELQPAASREVIARMLRTAPEIPPVEAIVPFGRRGFSVVNASPRYSFLPNLRLWDKDAMTVFMIVRGENFDPERLALTADYVSYLAKNRLPALPIWYLSGLMSVYGKVTFGGNELAVEPMEWLSAPATAALKKDPKTAVGLIPLADLFAGTVPPLPEGVTVDPVALWRAQAELLLRWALDGREAPRRAGFWKFVERTTLEGASGKLFTDCLGLDYAAALEQLTAYRLTAVKATMRFRPGRPARLPKLALRDAGEAEIGRIKGDWERMEIGFVARTSPELSAKYLEQARRTLMHAYDRNVRDPRLLAILGLCESDAGNAVRAREFLEAAASGGAIRPRAWYELARLRLAELEGNSPGANVQLAASELASVLTPLFEARRQEPPLPEVYELIAEAWAHSAIGPSRGHLQVLDEGVRLFPRRMALILRAAELNARHGFHAEAAAFVAHGLRVAGTDDERESLTRLQKQLEAVK
ncbi:MAG: hypothetical protein EXS38_10145 [Opitutus sp.]|nr:hypothetical protein [Opitutus sp.]